MDKATDNKEKDLDRTSKEINQAISELLSRSSRIRISGLKGQDNIAVGLKGDFEIDIVGNVGRYLGSFNSGPVIVVKGDCGDMCGDNLIGGGIIVRGACGERCGIAMRGGIVVIKGGIGKGGAKRNNGGTLLIEGDVRGNIGSYMKDGKVIICGDVHGSLGWMSEGGVFFCSGKIRKKNPSLEKVKMTGKDEISLKKYFDHYGIDAFPKGFTKYVHSEEGGRE